MKVGNPKQAIVLSIAAIGAIIFFLLRLIPVGSSPATAASGIANSDTAHTSPITGLPTEVLRDAFSHPALTKRFFATLPTDEGHESVQEAASPPHLFGNLPSAIEFDQVPATDAKGKPSENAGGTRQQAKKPNSTIELKGIMRTTTPLALVALVSSEGKQQELTVGLGEYIDNSHQITQFSQNAVQITSGEGKTWLYVGHQVTEK